MQAPLKELFTKSKLLILNFEEITADTPQIENIKAFFKTCEANGIDPKAPRNRQTFNNDLIDASNVRYLVCRYGEDRTSIIKDSIIEKEGRVLHLGIDIFCKALEDVYAPCGGVIIASGQEPGNHSFGNYIILKPDDLNTPSIFLGHLDANKTTSGRVKSGDKIAALGDYKNFENGGWSRHLHIQMLKDYNASEGIPIGYSSKVDIKTNRIKFPDPMPYFPAWKLS